MKILDVRATPLVRPLKETFRGGTYQITSRNTLVTEVEADNGQIGITFGGDEEKYQNDVVQVIESVLRPLLVGEDLWTVERLWDKMFQAEPGLENRGIHTLDLVNRAIHMQAIAAVDIALWDLLGKSCEVPLYKLLGGFRDAVPVIAIGGYYTDGRGDKELVEEMQSYRSAGLAGVKMKVGRTSVEEDVHRVHVVRKALGQEFVIACDANQAWVLEEAISFGLAVEGLGVRWLEEPVVWHEQLRGLRLLRQAVKIPVVAGQGEISRFGCRDLIVNEAVDIINVDATIAGGITEWRRVAAMASAFGVGIAHHEEPQVAVHLLASICHGLYVEIFPNPERDPMWFDLPAMQPEIMGGLMKVPQGPGLGMDLNSEIIAKYSAKSAVP